ncbi:protein kinase domain-containing protein, partial [Actinomyces slackii]|uniref:protein kinase domain-containing protein n=1 Tax=Actinomyces slackii TaxID=52774 RepID=UPI0039EA8724
MSPTTRPEPSRRHRTQPTGPADPPGAGSPGRSRRSRRARTGSQEHDEAGLSAQEHQALRSAGLAVGTPLARRLGPGAPLRALDAQGRHVVVRILEIPESEAGAAMLRRIAGMRALRHPALVPIREVICLPQGRAAVVMDLIEGASLDVVLGARGRLPSGQLATLLDALGSGLAHMHERGSIHGDVSSGNVVIDVSGQPVLIDLLGSVMETGTTSCAAPERLAGGPATPASDVYALAALLRECAGSSAAARRLERLIGDAMSERADQRPSARDLAARAPELAQPSPIVLPDGALLAAGSRRAAARTPTRMVEPRSRLARSGLPRADRPRMGRARPRRHLAVVTCAA